MILNEQLYKNLYRPYFRGYRDDYDEDKKIFKGFSYFTTNPLYALYYAKNNDIWVLSEYRLKNKINIFNARSKKDYFTLHSFLIKNNMGDKIKLLDKLKDHDWAFILEERDEFLDIIESLGYDGFFNYEYDKEMKKEILLQDKNAHLPSTDSNPAIGVINKDIFIKVQDYTSINEALSIDIVSDYKLKEIELLKEQFHLLKRTVNKDFAFNKCLSNISKWLVLSKNEVAKLINELYDEDKNLNENKKLLFNKIIESHNRDWID